MKLTKKLLREAKKGLHRRIKEVALMDDETLEKEFARCFPHREPNMIPVLKSGKRSELMQDAIDRTIPDHWCD